MSTNTYLKPVKSGELIYYTTDDKTLKFKIKTFKNINPVNSFKADYVRYVANAYNFILSRFAYWYDRKGQKPQSYIILSTEDLAKNIGCALSTVDRVLKSLEETFGIKRQRMNATGGVRMISITSQFVEFFSIYSEDKYQEYLDKYNVHGANEYTCRQVYRYRIWTTSDKNLTAEEKSERRDFVTRSNNKNYLHYVATSNRSDSARIKFVEKFRNKLTDLEKQQLQRIKNALSKLDYYLHKILIKLEQKCSGFGITKNDDHQEQQSTSTHERNQTEGVTAEQKSAARIHQKTPEDPDANALRFIAQFVFTWNKVAASESMNHIYRLTDNRIQSIMSLLEEYSEREIIDAIRCINSIDHNTKYKYKMSFERFIQSETMNYLLEYNPIDYNENDDTEDMFKSLKEAKELNSVPYFDSLHGLKTWIKNN